MIVKRLHNVCVMFYNHRMSPKKTGPKSLEEIYGKEFTDFRFKLTTEQHEHITQRAKQERVSTAEYLRRLIQTDMQRED